MSMPITFGSSNLNDFIFLVSDDYNSSKKEDYKVNRNQSDEAIERFKVIEKKISKINKFWTKQDEKMNDSILIKVVRFFKSPVQKIEKVPHFSRQTLPPVPNDALFLVFKNLRYGDLKNASEVCRQWRAVANDPIFSIREMRKYFPVLCTSKYSVYALAKGFRPYIPLAESMFKDRKTLNEITIKYYLTWLMSIIVFKVAVEIFTPGVSKLFNELGKRYDAQLETLLKETGWTRDQLDRVLMGKSSVPYPSLPVETSVYQFESSWYM